MSEFPESSDSEFPYSFSADGRLRHTHTGEPYRFQFHLRDALQTETEQRRLCRFLTQHVYTLLQQNFQMRLEEHCSVFMTPGALEHAGCLLLLLQDRGTVRGGLWSWKITAHEGLETGSQIPYLRWALMENYAVIIMNPNGDLHNKTPEEHVSAVWRRLVCVSAAQHVFVVAHGYGGLAFVDLLCCRMEEVQRRVTAVAFLDSSHSLWHQPLGKAGRDWLRCHSRTWILSTKALNRSVGSLKAGCTQISAGTQCHDSAPAVCMESVFRFFSKTIKPKAAPTPFEIITRSRSRSHDHNNNNKH